MLGMEDSGFEIVESSTDRHSPDKEQRTKDKGRELKDCFFQNEATDVVENKGSIDKMA